MDEDATGILCQSGGTAGSWGYEGTDGTVFLPAPLGTPENGDVGLLLDDVFVRVKTDPPIGNEVRVLVDVPVERFKEYCIAIEPPEVLPLPGVGGAYYVLDTPRETDDDFDQSLKDQPGYVKNTAGIYFHSLSEDEYEDEDSVKYIWTVGASSSTTPAPRPAMRTMGGAQTEPYMREPAPGQPAPDPAVAANPVAAIGTVWDRKPFAPPVTPAGQGGYLNVRAYAEGRIVSAVRSIYYKVLPGRIAVVYNAQTKVIKVELPGTAATPNSSSLFSMWRDAGSAGGSAIFNLALLDNAHGTLTTDGLYTLRWNEAGAYAGWGSDTFIFSREIIVDGDDATPSFTDVIWTPLPASWRPVENRTASVAVALDSTDYADYYIAPGGEGDGLSRESPASWEYLLGKRVDSTTTWGVLGSSQSQTKVVRAALGNYGFADDSWLLMVPTGVIVIGGHAVDYSKITGKSNIVDNDIYNGGTIENFAFDYQSRGPAWSASGYAGQGGTLRRCSIDYHTGPVTSEFDPAFGDPRFGGYRHTFPAPATLRGTRYEQCVVRMTGSHNVQISAALIGCDIECVGNGVEYLPLREEVNASWSWYWWDGQSVDSSSEYSYRDTHSPYSASAYVFAAQVLNSLIRMTGYTQTGVAGGSQWGTPTVGGFIKNSEVVLRAPAQSEGVVNSGEVADVEIELREDWFAQVTAPGGQYSGEPGSGYEPAWAYLSSQCWRWRAARALRYCMLEPQVECLFSVAVDSYIDIYCPKTPDGGAAGGGTYREVTRPSYTDWEWYDTGEWYREYDGEGNLIWEEPIYDYREVTIPAHEMRLWIPERNPDGQDACDVRIGLPRNLRNCRVKVVAEGCGDGGDGGDGLGAPVEDGVDVMLGCTYWYSLQCMPPMQGAANAPGRGGGMYVTGPDRWTPDCAFNISVVENSRSGTSNVVVTAIPTPTPGHIGRRAGMAYSPLWEYAEDQVVSHWTAQSGTGVPWPVFYRPTYNVATDGWHGGAGGAGGASPAIDTSTGASRTLHYAGGKGGNGIPVEGYREPGAGGVGGNGTAAASGIRLGDYWE